MFFKNCAVSKDLVHEHIVGHKAGPSPIYDKIKQTHFFFISPAYM